MTYKMILASVATITTLGSLGFAPRVLADSVGTADSTGKVTVQAGDDSKTDPLEPGDGGATGQTGQLTIDNATPLNFGQVQLAGAGQDKADESKTPNVQVTDKRGTGTGWQLTVKSSAFTEKTNKAYILKGATLTFPEGYVKTRTEDKDNNTAAPIAKAVEIYADGKSEASQIMEAKPDTGLGTWVNMFNGETEANHVQLHVTGGAYVGDYTATLTWTLADVPSN